LIPFYQELGLPISLIDLGVRETTVETITRVAEKSTLPDESIHVMPIGEITADKVIKAMVELESITV